MVTAPLPPQDCLSGDVLALLPGPDRRRSLTTYRYRLTYRSSERQAPGCVMLWEVTGGRLPYQIALERTREGDLQLHCSCADAVYRAEVEGRFCKHLNGLVEISRRQTQGSQRNLPAVGLSA